MVRQQEERYAVIDPNGNVINVIVGTVSLQGFRLVKLKGDEIVEPGSKFCDGGFKRKKKRLGAQEDLEIVLQALTRSAKKYSWCLAGGAITSAAAGLAIMDFDIFTPEPDRLLPVVRAIEEELGLIIRVTGSPYGLSPSLAFLSAVDLNVVAFTYSPEEGWQTLKEAIPSLLAKEFSLCSGTVVLDLFRLKKWAARLSWFRVPEDLWKKARPINPPVRFGLRDPIIQKLEWNDICRLIGHPDSALPTLSNPEFGAPPKPSRR